MATPVVEIEEGKLRGFIGSDIDGNPILSFLGIPFGKPAIGDLRFKAPQPTEPWSGILDATKAGSCCYHMSRLKNEIQGSEDCLNLNVFTRQLPEINNSLKPVMVWIHGGAFLHGSNGTEMFGPEFLLTADVVLVLVNYRLGFLGFLNFEDPSLEVTGNAGLKDQTLALKWVQRNIKFFNGDPDNVTLFGESAGAAAVHYQLLSPSCKGLFHKVILQSGSALNPWAQTKHSAIEFVKFMGKNVDNEKEALQYLRSVPVNDILVNQNKFIQSHETKISIIGPTIEKPNETEVISERPIDHIKSGNYNHVPMMIGYCSNEGLIAAVGDEMFHVPYSKGKEHNLDSFIPWFMDIQKESTESELVCKRIADVYLKEENIGDKFLLSSDFYFISGIIASAIQHARTSTCPVYLYRMDLDTDNNFLKILANIREHPGMCHADDLGYIFNITCVPGMNIGDVEHRAVRRCVDLWTNFAKYGNPTPKNNNLNVEWKPIEENHLHYLNIGNDGLVSDKNPELERMNTWRDIYRISPHTSGFM